MSVETKQSVEQSLAPFVPVKNDGQQAQVAILIPCFNEALTIKKVVTDFRRVLPSADIYVYDNNSTDDTGEIARKAGAIVRKEPRQGKGNVVRAMFNEIDADVYVMVDGDDTYPAESAPTMIQKVLDGYDMVIGDRLSSTYFEQNKRPFHNFGNVLVRWTINHLFRAHITDIMTGYRAMSFSFVKAYPAISTGFELETEMTIHALDKNVKITAIPVQYRDRPQGSVSKLNTVGDGVRVLRTIGKMIREYRPLPFFSWVGGIIGAVGLGFMISIFVDYWRTGLVMRFPTLFCAVFLLLTALLLFVAGIILDVIAVRDRKDFTVQTNMFDYFRRQKDHQQKDDKAQQE